VTTRRPAVAGTFYPAEPDELKEAITSSFMHRLGPGRLPGAGETDYAVAAYIVPHAGYEYSGAVAAHSYLSLSRLKRPELLVVVGPNHYSPYPRVATSPDWAWQTPMGGAAVDRGGSTAIEREGIAVPDAGGQAMEHSIEVQVPFLQYLFGPSVEFLPLCISEQGKETAIGLGEALARLARGRRALLLASSDLTHYEPADEAAPKDARLIESMKRMDTEGLYSTLEGLQVTACGYGAIAAVMHAARSLGLKKGELLKYANSGDTTGDFKQVVAYASLRFE
jgi:MEMO1 family protein